MVEPPRTHSKLSCRPDSPCRKAVRGGSVWSNHPELTRNSPVGLIPLAAKWSEEVRCGQNHPELTRNCPVGLIPLAAKWFEEVRCGQNHPELTRNCPGCHAYGVRLCKSLIFCHFFCLINSDLFR